MLVHSLKLSEFSQVDLDIGFLTHQLSEESKDIHDRGVEGAFLCAGTLGHGQEVGLDLRAEAYCSLSLEFCHGGAVVDPVHLEELIAELHVDYLLVLSEGLEAHHAKVWHGHGATHFDILNAPSLKS